MPRALSTALQTASVTDYYEAASLAPAASARKNRCIALVLVEKDVRLVWLYRRNSMYGWSLSRHRCAR